MLPREILNEYNIEKTAQNYGEKLFLRYFQDLESTPGAQTVTGIPMEVWLTQHELQTIIDNPETSPEEKGKTQEALEKLKTKTIFKLLKKFEEIDPTNNKEYVQWLLRTYINDQMSIEDVSSTIVEYLDKFNALKIKRHIKPPKNDVGQYKDFNSFMNEIDQYQDPFAVDQNKQAERGKYEVLYDADNLLVLQLKDKVAACFFGRGTRWCTASTRGQNYFSHYNKQGPLYDIIPRKPEHPGEKYQFHFASKQYAQESDRMLSQIELLQLVERYPQLADLFKPQAEKYGLFWLQKPVIKKGENYTVYIYKKDNRPYLRVIPKNPSHEKEEYFIQTDSQDGSKVYVKNEDDRLLTPIERYNFAENMPELLEKLGINIDGYNPKTAEKIQYDNKTAVKFTDRYVIIDAQDGRYIISTGVKDNNYALGVGGSYMDIDRGIFKWTPNKASERYSRNDTKYQMINPYEFMIKHPELVSVFKDAANQIQNDTHDLSTRHGENSSSTYGWMAPHSSVNMSTGKIYEFGQNGKAVVYYIKDNKPEEGVAISMNPSGEVDNMQTVDRNGDTINMTFLQQVAFIDKHPELKEFLPANKALTPEEIDIENATIKKYHTQIDRDGENIITKDNYFLIPKESRVPGEKYSISITRKGDIDPATNEVKNSIMTGADLYAFADTHSKPVALSTSAWSGRSSYSYQSSQNKVLPGVIRQLEEKFPGLENYISSDEVMKVSLSGLRSGFLPGPVIDNEKVKIQRYDPAGRYAGPAERGTPTLLVTEKQTGDTYIVNTYEKDRRGKSSKIGRIEVNKLGKDLIDWSENETDDKMLNLSFLKEPEILALFRKYPEMVDIIKKENIHTKTPHPALVKVVDRDEDLQVKTDNFIVERDPENSQREYIFFKDSNKPNLEFVFPERYSDIYGESDNTPCMIRFSPQYANERQKYGTAAWYYVLDSNPGLADYIKERTKNSSVSLVGASEPSEIKSLGNIREYIFNAKNGKLLYFTPITNPVKDSEADNAGNAWFNNGMAVPLTPELDRALHIPVYLKDNEEVMKEIQFHADEVHGNHSDYYGSNIARHLADTTDTIPANFNETENLYTIKKVGSKHPVYKFMWNVPGGPEIEYNYMKMAPKTLDEYNTKKERGEDYPNPAFAEFLVKIMKEVRSYGSSYRNFIRYPGIYIRPDNGDVGGVDFDGGLTSFSNTVDDVSLTNALYNNIPEFKKLLSSKKAKEDGVIPEQVRKLKSEWTTIDSDETYYLNIVKKSKGTSYPAASSRSWGNRSKSVKLPPGTLYEILAKRKETGVTAVGNVLYFPEKGPVIIFDNYGDKITYTTDEKIHKFISRFPELKQILSPFAKSNKWLRESSEDIINYLLTESELVYDYFDETTSEEIDPYVSLLENELAESLGDLAWAKREAEKRQAKTKKDWKPNYHFVKPGELRGSYTDQQMKDLGFKMASSGSWYMPATKFQDLINSGKLREDEQAILEGKKLPRTSEFLQTKQDLQRLAGIIEQKDDGSNISYTASKISKIMKDKDIQPGTDEWFRLWFAKPYLTGEKPYEN